jgi:hypothetical protein
VARYRCDYDLKHKQLQGFSDPTLYTTRFTPPQLELIELDDAQWVKFQQRPARTYSKRIAMLPKQLPLIDLGVSALILLVLKTGLPTFIGDDVNRMREAARQTLGLFTTLPFFQRLFRVSGFEEEAAQMEQGQAGPESLTDRLLDAVCLLGSLERCQDQLSAFCGSGVDMPILMPPLGVESARAVIQAFRR